MKFKYVGYGDDSPREIVFMGKVKFELGGRSVDVKDEELIAKLEGNKCFSAVKEKPAGKPIAEVKKLG